MKSLPYLPHIVSISYLGEIEDRRPVRLQFHLEQRQTLANLFPGRRILSICSGYTEEEKKHFEGYDCLHLKKRHLKYKKQNMALELLYQKERRSLLLLDDDVVPFHDKGLMKTEQVIANWLDHPEKMPAPCVFFSCQGLYYDLFYNKRTKALRNAPMRVAGWAMMVRNDLQVLYSDKMCVEPKTGLVLDDLPFRGYCHVLGKKVVKHDLAFFKSFQGTSHNKSAWFKDKEFRDATRHAHEHYLLEQFPGFFYLNRKNGKVMMNKKRPTKGLLDE